MRKASEAVCTIRRMTPRDANSILTMRVENRDFFWPWEPQGSHQLYTLDGVKRDLAQREIDWGEDRRYSFVIEAPDGRVAGGIILANVARGAFQNANVGYYVGEEFNGRGFATEALKQVVRFAFEQARLHRVEAGIMDHNERSKRVVTKAGFRREGTALHYLQIEGRWRDHNIYAITREDWEAARGS
ncbi:MAG TPA: GNAT family N-acetyltransferase [Actinomycetota bacterium]|nr:GNAT family N-acetyltransferase [Actinomycetota bacterium]